MLTLTPPLRVLHLVGSAVSEFFHDLSTLYARDVVTPPDVRAEFAVVVPGGNWRFGLTLDSLGPEMPFADALPAMPDIDLVVPHMFCPSGMSTYRALFEDILRIPIVGSPARTTSVATDKAWTRALLSSAGLDVPDGVLLRPGDPLPDMNTPLIVKPNGADNSAGLSLVRNPAKLGTAVAEAREHDELVLVEDFIPGREIRFCVVEGPNGLSVPAMMEYPLDADTPIRAPEDKLDVDETGRVKSQTTRREAKPTLPAQLSPDLVQRLETAARTAHRALDCRHYSLWDVRVEEGTDRIVFLEAGLFWAFSRISMVSAMIEATPEHDLDADIGWLWRRAAGKLDHESAETPAQSVETVRA